MRVTRNDFLKLGLSTFGTLYLGCSGTEGEGTGGTGGTGGVLGTGGDTTSGGSGGASSSGGASASGGSASGGASTGGASTGGASSGTGGSGSGDACGAAISAKSSGEKHTHDVSLSLEEILAGVELQKMTTTASSHSHTITFTAADLATLKAGGTITKTTCDGGDHEFVLSCATPNRVAVLPTCCDGDSATNCPN